MQNKINSPEAWFDGLRTAIESTLVRIDGRQVPLKEGLSEFQALLRQVRQRSSSVWWVGNGGSLALCSHLSQDLVNKAKIRSMVLSDPSLITCMANDYGYPKVYAEPLSTLVRESDLLIAISSSGKSQNILACAELARKKKLNLVTLSSFDVENPLWSFPADVSFYLPSSLYGIAEVGHEALLHAAIETLSVEVGQN